MCTILSVLNYMCTGTRKLYMQNLFLDFHNQYTSMTLYGIAMPCSVSPAEKCLRSKQLY